MTPTPRQAALTAFARSAPETPAWVDYQSQGRLLLIAPPGQDADGIDPIGLAASFQAPLACSLLLLGQTGPGQQEALQARAQAQGIALWLGEKATIEGHLGCFRLQTDARGRLLSGTPRPAADYDLVLDLCRPPLIERELNPPGYFSPDPGAITPGELQGTLAALVGGLQKPRYFAYDPSICAHARSGIEACRRCLDVCPSWAIRPQGDGIVVDPHLCQGAGSCATACPSGAIRYDYPAAGTLLRALREGLLDYRRAGGERPVIIFHDEAGAEAAAGLAGGLLPFPLEEIGSVGLETWLAALAWGAAGVGLLAGPETPASVVRELRTQLGVASALLEGQSLGADRVALILLREGRLPADSFAGLVDWPAGTALARHAAMESKRDNLWLAIDALCQRGDDLPEVLALPAAAPLGGITVDAERCTLCMACPAVCPAGALLAGGEEPALHFIESECLQCGLCRQACPEAAISLQPGLRIDSGVRCRPRTLNRDTPFECLRCGKPFSTRRMIATIVARLDGHPMFEDAVARRSLEMCEDCRVVAMLEAESERADEASR